MVSLSRYGITKRLPQVFIFCDSRDKKEGKCYLRRLLRQYLRRKEIVKLTSVPTEVRTTVRTISPEVILTKKMVMIPPRVPYLVWPVNKVSAILFLFHLYR